MLEYRLDSKNSVLYLRPTSALTEEDFAGLAKVVDPYIEKNGSLAGLLIEVSAFPGWESLGAMAAHFRFVKEHHKNIKRIALVTDAAIGNVAERLGSHFIAADIRHFPAADRAKAEKWILDRP